GYASTVRDDQFRREHTRQPLVGVWLEAFGAVDDQRVGLEMRGQLAGQLPQEAGNDRDHHDLGLVDGGAEIAGDLDARRHADVREILSILPVTGDARRQLRPPRPESYVVPLVRQLDGQRRAPATSVD